MKKFMDKDFLLNNETAKKIFDVYAKDMPIYDYHCHIPPEDIANNRKFNDIAEAWLGGDHYKWRAMRSCGIDEEYITGSKSNREKFQKWAETMPFLIGNPLYHWTHLELQRFFDISETLDGNSAESIWKICNEKLQSDEFTARKLIERSNVYGLCTTDDPIDSLEHHIAIKNDTSFSVKVLPTFRPDKAVNINKTEMFCDWLEQLAIVVKKDITSFADLLNALSERIEFFTSVGCCLSDHGLDELVFEDATKEELENIFSRGLLGEKLTNLEVAKYKSAVLLFLGKEYKKHGWVMQYHFGATRNNNGRMFEQLGADTGFDAVGDNLVADGLSKMLNELDKIDQLPRTIIYNLNPKDNFVVGTLIGCFQREDSVSKIQFGSGWWFNDQKEGMIQQLKDLGNLGILGKFVGMLTDSRSLLSYTRHEYFRRILCNLLGEWIENGEYPDNEEYLKEIVEGISFNNIYNYLGFAE